MFMRYVEDRDLWRNSLANSEAFAAALFCERRDFQRWATLCGWQGRQGGDGDEGGPEEVLEKLLRRGAVMHEHGEAIVYKVAGQAAIRRMRCAPDLKCAVVNTCVMQSEVGNRLCNNERLGVDFAMMWTYDHKRACIRCSLRSLHEDRCDVAQIAANFGGGGHKCAAGFGLTNPGAVAKGVEGLLFPAGE
jgi:hypothetical protein